MKPYQHFLFCGVLAMTAASAHAQQRLFSEAATAEQRLAEDLGAERLPQGTVVPTPGEIRNVATLLQIGAGNSARIDQQNPSIPSNQAYIVQVGIANILALNQIGSKNSAFVSQNGSGNNAGFTQNGQGNSSVVTQNGSGNKLQGLQDGSNFLLEGDRDATKITQDGNNNTVKGDLRVSDRIYDIKQYGNNNTLTQVESMQQMPKGYSVEMRGQGIHLTIEQGKVLP